MSDKRAPRHSLDDWMELVTECRQSGLTDAAWCEAQGISPSCFYNARTDFSMKFRTAIKEGFLPKCVIAVFFLGNAFKLTFEFLISFS